MEPSRAFMKDVKRVVVKVGTAVVTRADGKLAIGRLGSVCEQVKELLQEKKEVIFVTSGAVGVGRQRLGHQQWINSSIAELQNLRRIELDGKACAAVGQSGLMALYDHLFSLLDVGSAQLLVTDNDFRDTEFRAQLSETVLSLLSLRVVPVFNENDAVSTRKAPYKDASGIFWDNDSLAALLAMELKADLLILLSDVEGLYTGPPSDPKSKLIHTYLKEKHDDMVTFGEKSRVGRGGMNAKVCAAWNAASVGIPVVITRSSSIAMHRVHFDVCELEKLKLTEGVVCSGHSTDCLQRVLRGDRVGTLFHRDAKQWVSVNESGAREMAVAARDASRRLEALSTVERRDALLNVADALVANEDLIKAENEADVQAAHQSKISPSLIGRLTLKPGKIAILAKSIRVLADMEEPVGKLLLRTEVSEGLILEKRSAALGVVLIIFESRPDALVQIASLAIRSGNGLLLKGGKEAARSNAILHKIITEALPQSVGRELIGLVTSRDEIPDLLKLDDAIDLVIPRGSNELVSKIKESTKIPVLGHADGVCHVYVDKAADMEMAKKIVLDCKVDYPAACNAMETLLVHESLINSGGWDILSFSLQVAGVKLYGGPRAAEVLKLPKAVNLHKEYSGLECTVEIVKDVFTAINHINKFGSSHTDCIVTENTEVAEIFLQQVDSAAVLRNASTRFCDGFRFGFGAEVGISTGRIHARGPVGVEGLLTSKWYVRGNGQVVDGDKGVVYTHKNLSLEDFVCKYPDSNGNEHDKLLEFSNDLHHVNGNVAANGGGSPVREIL